MQSKGKVLVSTALGAALAGVFSGCGHAGRTDGEPSGVAAQGENGANAAQPTNAEVMACGQPIEGVLTMEAPLMNGVFLPHGWTPPPPPPEPKYDVASTCDNPLPMPAMDPGAPYHYQSFTFTNPSDAASCISVQVDLTPQAGDAAEWFDTVAYLDSFDPSDITKNYIANYLGAPVDSNIAKFSFNVPAHAKFIVVASAGETCIGCPSRKLQAHYTLSVTGCGQTESDGGSSSGGGASSGDDAASSGGTNGKTW